MSLPIWVTNYILNSTLREYFKDKTIEIETIFCKEAVPVGDNYTSDLYRATITYKTSKTLEPRAISLIIKCCADSGPKEMLAKEIGLFEKESSMFNKTIPRLHSILNENPDTENSYFAAGCMLAQSEPKGLLILQDLAPLGYTMGERRNGLDLEHCKLVLDRLAKVHAASAMLYMKDPKSMVQYDKGIFTNQQENKVIEGFVMKGFKSMVAAVEKWEGYEKYAAKLVKIEPKLFSKSVSIAARNDEGFNVLNHGDLWTNNILFRYDQHGKPVDLRFVDFQMSVFSSPAVDLQYFFTTSPSLEVLHGGVSQLLSHYHRSLSAALGALGHPDPPSLAAISTDFRSRAFYGLVAAATVLPLVRAPKRDDATYNDLVGDDDSEGGFRQASYNCRGYRETLEQLLPGYDKQGLLD